MPLVSVIIGTYNSAPFLPGLWACLDAQKFRDFEVVVVDDASTDEATVRELEARGDRIRLMRRATNSATCELPRYQGTKEARGKYAAFLDADDRWDPTFLERTVGYLEAHPDTPLVHAAVRVIDGADRVLRIRHEGNMPQGDTVARELLRHCFITISAVVVRRDVWLAAQREDDLTDFGMDLDFFLNIARRHPIGFIPDVLASYRRSDASVSVKKWRRAPRNVNTLERILRNGAWEGLVSKDEMMAIVTDAYAEDAEYWRHAGEPGRALWFCRRGLRHRPWDARLLGSAIKSLIGSARRSGRPSEPAGSRADG